MSVVNNKFNLAIIEEKKVNKSNYLIFQVNIQGDGNCRLRFEGCNGFDMKGDKYEATINEINPSDIVIGSSRFFKESQKVAINMGEQFKAKNGCSIVVLINDLDQKINQKICFQKKGTRWDVIGIQ